MAATIWRARAPVAAGGWMLCIQVLLVTSVCADQRPNVLFIAVDDMRVELGCYGDKHVLSPNIDRLAAQGTLFTRAYCQQTVCNPSRASLLTGLRPGTLEVWDLPTHFRQRRPDLVTLPQCFKANGYYAQCIGKIFHNWVQDDWRGDAISWSLPAVLHYGRHGDDEPQVDGTLPPNVATLKLTECRDIADEAYYDGRVAEQAVAALGQLAKSGKPFFLGVGFWKPHTPFNAPKKYWDLYDRQAVPVPKQISPPVDAPAMAMASSRFQGDADALRELHHGHLAAISYVDAQIGRVLDQLHAVGLNENTIIVFWSDHGLHIGEHGLINKTTLFELDAGVPMIIATPQHQPGQRTDALVELLDLYPTLLQLCRLRAPHRLEGTSLVPLLEDPSAKVKTSALTVSPRPNYLRRKPPKAMGYSIRTDRFRYTEWHDFETGENLASELYDHRHDAGETQNKINDPSFADDVSRLQQEIQRYTKRQ